MTESPAMLLSTWCAPGRLLCFATVLTAALTMGCARKGAGTSPDAGSVSAGSPSDRSGANGCQERTGLPVGTASWTGALPALSPVGTSASRTTGDSRADVVFVPKDVAVNSFTLLGFQAMTIAFTDFANACGHLQDGQVGTANPFSKANSETLYLTIAAGRGAPWPPRALAYKVTKDGLIDPHAPHSGNYLVQGFLFRYDAACAISGQIGFGLSGGEFTLTAVDASHVAGRFDAQITYMDFTQLKGPETRHIAATFDAAVCQAPMANLGSEKCCLR